MTSTATPNTCPVPAGRGVLVGLRENRVAARAVEVQRAELVVAWVREGAITPGDVNANSDDVVAGGGVFDPDVHVGLPGTEEPMRLAGDGAPWVSDLGFVSLATALGMSNEAALGFVGAVVELAYRLPVLWGRVRAGQVSINRARAVTRMTKRLPAEGAAWVDGQVAWTIGSCSMTQIERTVAAAMEAFDPEQAERDQQAALEGRRVNIHLGDLSTAADPSSGAVVGFDGGLDVADALDLEAAVSARAAALRTFMPDASEDVRRSIALGDLARGQATMPAGGLDAEAAAGTGTHTSTHTGTGTGASAGTVGIGGPGSTPGAPGDTIAPSAPGAPGAADATDATGAVGGGGPVAEPGVDGRTVMLYLHLSANPTDPTGAAVIGNLTGAGAGDGAGGGFGPGVVGRCENTRSPVTPEQVRSWCGTAGRVLVRPVIDLNEDYSATTYEASPRLREQVILRDRTCAFPFCGRSARSADLDHITAHEDGGATRSRNLAALCRLCGTPHNRHYAESRIMRSRVREGVMVRAAAVLESA